MPENLDLIHDRLNSDSIKWHLYDPDVIPLWVADMDFLSPEPVIRALQERVAHGIFGYAKVSEELADVLVTRMDRLYGWKITPEDIIYFPGVVLGANLAIHALTTPADSIIMQTPLYPYLMAGPSVTGRHLQQCPLAKRDGGYYEIDYDRFEAYIDSTTRMFTLCSPHNPVGRVWRKEELERMAEICLSHDMYICSDEIHSDLVYSSHPHTPIAALSPEVGQRSVTMIAPSKTYNIPGLNAAVAIVQNPEIRKRMNAARQGLITNVNLLGMTAMLAAYRDGGEWLKNVLQYLESNRDFLYDYVNNEMPGISMFRLEGTYLAWLDCTEAHLPEQPGKFFLEKARVALNEGAGFNPGGEDHARLNFACPRTTLTAGLERMKAALQNR
jgi:cystathionine beta-lyase